MADESTEKIWSAILGRYRDTRPPSRRPEDLLKSDAEIQAELKEKLDAAHEARNKASHEASIANTRKEQAPPTDEEVEAYVEHGGPVEERGARKVSMALLKQLRQSREDRRKGE